MKKLIICLLGLTFLSNHSFSQPEKQWMIWDSKGKVGVTTGGYNNYPTSNPIDKEFTLYGIASPNVGVIGNARNDIFIIYTDGEHYNSRDVNPDPFTPQAADYPGVTSHNVKTNRAAGVKYMYLTNRYEGDDPPPAVRAMAGQVSGISHNYIVNATQTALSANHDIAIGKDITIIVNYDSIYNPNHEIIELKFDGIRPSGGGAVTTGVNILDLKPVFGTAFSDPRQAVYPNPTVYPASGESIALQPAAPTEHYRYVNLKTNQNIYALAPAEKGAPPRFDAVFTVTRGGQQMGQPYYSPIGLAHDPNFLAVKSICMREDGSHVITYHLEFENDGDGDATTLKAEVEFPSYFDLSCVYAFEWHAAGTLCHGTVAVNGNIATFSFLGHGLLRSKFVNHQESSGYVEFNVIVNKGTDVSDLNTSLELINPTVYFDTQHFPLNEFRDLIKCDIDKSNSLAGHGKSGAGATKEDKQKAKEQEQAKGKEKPKGEKEKYVKQDSSGVSKDTSKLKQASMSGMGMSINCYRPITPGKCVCKPPICWACIWAGIAVGLLSISFIVYRIMKRRNPRPPLDK